jgi:hypothetical protein
LIPYFVAATGMVVFNQLYHYNNLIIELTVNTLFIIGFIVFAQLKDKTITVLFRKSIV